MWEKSCVCVCVCVCVCIADLVLAVGLWWCCRWASRWESQSRRRTELRPLSQSPYPPEPAHTHTQTDVHAHTLRWEQTQEPCPLTLIRPMVIRTDGSTRSNRKQTVWEQRFLCSPLQIQQFQGLPPFLRILFREDFRKFGTQKLIPFISLKWK